MKCVRIKENTGYLKETLCMEKKSRERARVRESEEQSNCSKCREQFSGK
jgi:hypothetical protein